MKKTFITLLSALFVLCAGGAWADIYQWVDKDGVKHFSDNVLEVPEDQRPKVRVHKTLDNEPAKTSEQIAVQDETEPAEEPAQAPDTRDSLIAEKDQIEKEYESIRKEQEELVSNQDKMEIEAYNRQVKDLNIRIMKYEKKKIAYEKRVKAYNDKIAGPKPEGGTENEEQTEE